MMQIYKIKSKNTLEISKKISHNIPPAIGKNTQARNFLRNSSNNLKIIRIFTELIFRNTE